jgi:hypothetical protein
MRNANASLRELKPIFFFGNSFSVERYKRCCFGNFVLCNWKTMMRFGVEHVISDV